MQYTVCIWNVFPNVSRQVIEVPSNSAFQNYYTCLKNASVVWGSGPRIPRILWSVLGHSNHVAMPWWGAEQVYWWWLFVQCPVIIPLSCRCFGNFVCSCHCDNSRWCCWLPVNSHLSRHRHTLLTAFRSWHRGNGVHSVRRLDPVSVGISTNFVSVSKCVWQDAIAGASYGNQSLDLDVVLSSRECWCVSHALISVLVACIVRNVFSWH